MQSGFGVFLCLVDVMMDGYIDVMLMFWMNLSRSSSDFLKRKIQLLNLTVAIRCDRTVFCLTSKKNAI